jgi:3-deoxy-D-arabino-heptulosonate 7-phosphate (DAHP) synthase
MFSGRPNPTWNLSEAEQRQILDRVRGRTLAHVEVPDSRLGYRGIVIDPSEDSIAEIPQGFRIESFSGAGLTTKGQLSPDEEKEIA